MQVFNIVHIPTAKALIPLQTTTFNATYRHIIRDAPDIRPDISYLNPGAYHLVPVKIFCNLTTTASKQQARTISLLSSFNAQYF